MPVLAGLPGSSINSPEMRSRPAGSSPVTSYRRAVSWRRNSGCHGTPSLARLVDSGALRPAVSAVFGLEVLPTAFAAQRTRHSPGKVVIEVNQQG
jgi:NADPH:quinone reductase-like Zn-dependent oxidoreductase